MDTRKVNAPAPKVALPSPTVAVEEEWDKFELDPNDLKPEAKIGAGVTAEVYRANWLGTVVAVKQLRWTGALPAKLLLAFRRELSILAKCRHPNLVLFMGAVTKSSALKIVCEFCEGGTVFDLIHNRLDILLTLEQKIKMLMDIAKAVCYLHSMNPMIVHRDLKSLK